MVWSRPGDPEPPPKYQHQTSRNSSRRRPRRSSTSTVFTTTTGYMEGDDDGTTTYSQNPQSTIPLAYAPSEETTATRTFTQISRSHISQTPHPSQEYQSQELFIPSAQLTTPIFPPPSGPTFSTSDEPSPLPSPPGSVPSIPSSPVHSRRTSSFGSMRRRRSSTPAPPIEEGPPSQSPPDQTPRKTTPSRGGNRGRGRGRPRGRGRGNNQARQDRHSIPHQSSQSTEEGTMDMSTLFEGIGRMHIAMNQDPAGRWRIKRRERDEWD